MLVDDDDKDEGRCETLTFGSIVERHITETDNQYDKNIISRYMKAFV